MPLQTGFMSISFSTFVTGKPLRLEPMLGSNVTVECTPRVKLSVTYSTFSLYMHCLMTFVVFVIRCFIFTLVALVSFITGLLVLLSRRSLAKSAQALGAGILSLSRLFFCGFKGSRWSLAGGCRLCLASCRWACDIPSLSRICHSGCCPWHFRRSRWESAGGSLIMKLQQAFGSFILVMNFLPSPLFTVCGVVASRIAFWWQYRFKCWFGFYGRLFCFIVCYCSARERLCINLMSAVRFIVFIEDIGLL